MERDLLSKVLAAEREIQAKIESEKKQIEEPPIVSNQKNISIRKNRHFHFAVT